MTGTDSRRSAWFDPRTGVLVATGLALAALVGYLLLTNYRSALRVRDNLLTQRVQHVRSHALAVGHFLASASEDLRYLAESREVAAFYESRDLGMSMQYGLALSLVPIGDRMRALVQQLGDTPSRFERVELIDESGRVLVDSGGGGRPPWSDDPRLTTSGGKVVLTSDGRLAIARPHLFKGRRVGLFVARLRLESVLGVLPPAQARTDSSFVILDQEGRRCTAERAGPTGDLPARLAAIPADGRMVELSEASGSEAPARFLAVRVMIPGQDLSLAQVDRRDDLVGALSPRASAVQLTVATFAVILLLGLALFLNTRSLVLQARLDESLRREKEIAEKRDALEREIAERERLEAAHAVLAMAVGQAAEAIAVADERGVLEYSNAAFQLMAGEVQVRGRLAADLFTAGAGDGGLPGLAQALSRTTPWKGELSIRSSAGDPIDAEVVTSPVQSRGGAIIKYVIVARDVTEEKRLRDQLRHSQKLEAIGTLAGGVAHDFRNLLAAIKANAEFCLDGMPSSDPSRQDVLQILEAVARSVELTRQLLAFGRRQVLKPETLEINGVVSSVERMLRRTIGENIELETRLGDDLALVHVDRGQLEQVLVNLVVNARDAMPRGGRLIVSTEGVLLDEADARRLEAPAPGEYVKVSVTDDGVGMDPVTLTRIFEPFFTTKPQGKGTGLGLATVYGIVQQSRGVIAVRSAPEEGATFDIYLPAHREAPTAARVPAPPPVEACRVPAGRADEVVLVVEDEEQLRAALQRQLASEGYQVLTAADGRDAVALLASVERIDLLLSDVVMPHLGGSELARLFRARHPTAPVILMTGYSDEAVARDGELGPAAALIQKPYDFPDLAQLVRRLLDAADPAAACPPLLTSVG
jgi:PAS domain S-box-containing protein